MIILEDRILLHLQQFVGRIAVARRTRQFHSDRRTSPRSTDVRQLSELIGAFEPLGFAQIHRSWAVNLRRVREIRPVPDGGWEVKLDPPVNRVLAVSRRRISTLWKRFGE